MTPALTASLLLLFVTISYIGMCAASPFGNCRKCRGWGFATKTNRKGQTRRGRDCRRCKATGKRIRVGRWAYNRLSRIHRAGTR